MRAISLFLFLLFCLWLPDLGIAHSMPSHSTTASMVVCCDLVKGAAYFGGQAHQRLWRPHDCWCVHDCYLMCEGGHQRLHRCLTRTDAAGGVYQTSVWWLISTSTFYFQPPAHMSRQRAQRRHSPGSGVPHLRCESRVGCATQPPHYVLGSVR